MCTFPHLLFSAETPAELHHRVPTNSPVLVRLSASWTSSPPRWTTNIVPTISIPYYPSVTHDPTVSTKKT
ncbi:unnamed protein product [Caenorhabditis nigoni]